MYHHINNLPERILQWPLLSTPPAIISTRSLMPSPSSPMHISPAMTIFSSIEPGFPRQMRLFGPQTGSTTPQPARQQQVHRPLTDTTPSPPTNPIPPR